MRFVGLAMNLPRPVEPEGLWTVPAKNPSRQGEVHRPQYPLAYAGWWRHKRLN
jgi:hypothetical protein